MSNLDMDKINEVVNREIKPFLAMHNGSIEVVDIEDNLLIIRLTGGCSGCPSSQITIFNSIIPILRSHFGDDLEVLPCV